MALLLSGAFRSSDAAAATAGAAVRHAPRHARGHAPHARLGAAGGALLLFTVACCCCCAPAAAAAAGIAAASASSSSSSSATSGGSSAATNATGVLAFAGPPPATPLDRIFTALNPFRLFGLGDGSSAAEEAPSPFDGPNFLRLDGGNPDAPVAAPGTANLRNFVKVQGTAFVLGCREFPMVGFNSYTLVEMGAEAPYGSWGSDWSLDGRNHLRLLLDDAQAAGMRFIRTWAFSVNPTHPLQVEPNVYDARVLRGLDFLLAECTKRRMRVILVFVDYWQDLVGGIREYVNWHGGVSRPREDFFSDRRCKETYKRHVKAILMRRNSITGVVYREDPAILAWELINEPRCRGCMGNLRSWIREMAAFVKRIDPHHMLSVGEEGFYAFPTSSPNAASANPAVWAWSIGQDFIDDHSNPNIDFATTHLWPENWGIFSTTSLAPVEFAERWLWAHIRDAHRMLGKPLLVEEFGRSQQLDAFGGTRDAFYDAIFRLVEKARAEGYGVYGTAFWALFSDAAGSVNDQYGIFPGDIGVMGRVARHSAAMRNLSRAVLAQEQPPPVSAAAGGRGEWWGQDGPPACGRASSSSMG